MSKKEAITQMKKLLEVQSELYRLAKKETDEKKKMLLLTAANSIHTTLNQLESLKNNYGS